MEHLTGTYASMREQVKDGDFIFFKAESLKQRFICWFTGGQHSHCGIANWLEDGEGTKRLMLIESFVGGCRMVTLSSYSQRGADLLRVDGMDWAKVAEYVTAKTGVVHYGMSDFITIGLRDLLIRVGIKSKTILSLLPNGDGEVCSEMLADVLSKFKIMETTLISPERLYDLLFARNWVKTHIELSK